MQVENGKLVGVLPFEHDPAPNKLIDAWPEMLTSPLRVAAPVARRGWLRGDGGAGRGQDGFVELGWEDALDLVAGELRDVIAQYGNLAIFGGSYGWSSAGRIHHARSLLHRFLHGIGGCTGQVTNYSYGAAMAFLPRVLGAIDAVGGALTSWDSIAEHTDIMLAMGGIAAKNWQVRSGGFGAHLYPTRMRQLAGAPLRLINLSPDHDDLPRDNGEWMPLRPNTDAALLIALTQRIVATSRHDRAALQHLCTGFDRYAAYLAGAEDGIAKTPAWAATITGMTEDTITALADSLPGKRVMLAATWSLQRARHGEQPYWAAIALACTLGQVGLPGGGFAFGYGSSNGMGNPPYDLPLSGIPVPRNPTGLRIPVARIADLLLNPGDTIRFNGAELTYPDIKLIHWAGGNPFHHHQDLNRLARAFRRPRTVIVQEQFWTATARHADIVLPATTSIERNDIAGSSRDPFFLAMHQGVQPVGRARNDYDILAALAERLGTHAAFTEGRGEMDWVRGSWARSKKILADRGIETPSFEDFWEQGYFRLPEPPRERRFVMLGSFAADPHAARLTTPSGQIELFSQAVADMADPEQPGHPVWNDPEEWLGAPIAARFPLHLLTPQPARRLHGQMESSSYSRAGRRQDRELLRLNPRDAGHRGIVSGDMVRIFNDRGACLANAEVTEAMMAGVISLPTGASFDPDGEKLDRGSNPNVLTLDRGTSQLGQGCAAQSCLVEVEKLQGAPPELRSHAPPPIEKRAGGDVGKEGLLF